MTESCERTIKEWMEIFEHLYENVDTNRTPEQIWIAISAHCSTIGESIRKFHFQELMENSAHAFCWVCSYVSKCNNTETDPLFKLSGSLSEWVSNKYPDKCGHCKSNPCSCRAKDMDEKKDKAGQYRELFEIKNQKHFDWDKQSISGWQRIFDNIYGQQVHVQSFESIGFHFLEEVGECAKAIRCLSQLNNTTHDPELGINPDFLNQLTTYGTLLDQYERYHKEIPIPKIEDTSSYKDFFTSTKKDILKSRIVHAKMDMVIEMADIFSWYCTILNKMGNISEKISRSGDFKINTLEDELNKIYSDGCGNFVCPVCKQDKCICTFIIKERKKEDVE